MAGKTYSYIENVLQPQEDLGMLHLLRIYMDGQVLVLLLTPVSPLDSGNHTPGQQCRQQAAETPHRKCSMWHPHGSNIVLLQHISRIRDRV